MSAGTTPIKPFRQWSVRSRLTVWYLAGALVCFAFLSFATVAVVRGILEYNADRAMRLLAKYMVKEVIRPHVSPLYFADPTAKIPDSLISDLARPEFAVVEWDATGHPMYEQIRRAGTRTVIAATADFGAADRLTKIVDRYYMRQAPDGGRTVYAGDNGSRTYRVLEIHLPNTNCDLIVASLWTRNERLVTFVSCVVFAVVTIIAIICGFGAWALVDFTLKPIDTIIDAAVANTGGSLPAELVTESGLHDDEIGRLIRSLNSLMKHVSRSLETQRRFTADASHDLGTPVAILSAEIQIALSGELSSESYREVLLSAREEVERLKRIVSDLSVLASGEDSASASLLKRQNVDVAQSCRLVVDGRMSYASVHGIQLSLDVDAAAGDAVVLGNPDHLERAIGNLVDNAIKYNRPGGSVNVRVETRSCDQPVVSISVTDSGIGIADDNRRRIFDRFFRVDQCARDRSDGLGGGNGLGLSITKSIIGDHGGTISVESELGIGSCFTVALPLFEPAETGNLAHQSA